ncbi:SapC family protein [Sulfurimonas sp. NW15]|uniref:SapC family protein n=1 Tax=Sulfurimonas sp. NW15 TaxID=2922729 RepID=UPI003DA90277
MARKERLFVDNTALHIGIQGINEERIFREEEDTLFYKNLLKNLSQDLRVGIHTYALMPSEVHLLCTFSDKDSLSRFMQSVGLKYVSYFNKKYNRSGTLWQGRYKSSPVEDRYILEVMHYIESLKDKTLETTDDFTVQHDVYKLLGRDNADRELAYKNRFLAAPLLDDAKSFIANCLNKQLPTGSLEFYKKLETITGHSLLSQKRGRPKKNKTKGKKMVNNFVVLDKETHKNLKISPLENLKFAKEMGFVPVLANEVTKIAQMFPVVFTGDEMPTLVALTSLGGPNLAVNSEGKYIAQYVPAFLRKYPFSLGSTKENPDQKVILIEEEAEVFSKTKGKQLFKKDGSQSDTLKNTINFLTAYEKDANITANVAKIINESGILEEREISVGEGDEKKVLVNGFKVINREKLNALSDDILADWVRKGIITLIDAHLKSLDNIQTLFNIAQQRQN